MTATEMKWSERVASWRASGRSAEEFAVGQGYEGSTLRLWSSKLKARTAARTTPAIARVIRRSAAPPSPVPASDELIVEVGATRIVVRHGFDGELLRDVVAALRASR